MIPLDPYLPSPDSPNFSFALKDYLIKMAKDINKMSGSEWDKNHPVLGAYHLWVDSTGDLRIKSSQPASDTDGTVIGTQS